ncbi:hypothetical protein JOM56_014742 [Amanita muscaria]
MLISSDIAQSIVFSPEIICEIISHLREDKKTLLALGLVSKQTLYESRHHLFSIVHFSAPRDDSYVWEDLHRFLRLVDVAWTSFTHTTQCISLQNLNDRPAHDDGTGRYIPVARIRINLHKVKSLRLSNVKWSYTPSYILALVLQFPIEHLSLFWCDASNISNLLSGLAPSLKTLDMTGMTFATIPEDPYISHRSSRFRSRSLFLLKVAREPSICRDLDIKVKTFRLSPTPHERSHESAKMIDIVQKLLSALPSPMLLQEIRIAVKPVTPSLEGDLTMLELFEWSSLVETIQQLFPGLKKLAIRIGTRSPSQDPNPYLDLLRRFSNVKQLEKEGLIELCVI